MTTLYTAIKDDLLAKIRDGTYAEGDTIPSEVDLAKTYGVSRPTVRQALQILTEEGYLDRRKRRGTVVATRKGTEVEEQRLFDFELSPIRGVLSFEEQMSSSGENVRTLCIVATEEPASESVAAVMRIEPGESVYKLVRLRYVNDLPNVFMENYVRGEAYPAFLDGVDFSETRLYQHMRDLGRPVRSVDRRIDVIKADSSIATLLDVAIGDPMFYLHTRGMDADGLVVEYSISTYRGNTNSFGFSVANPESEPDYRPASDR